MPHKSPGWRRAAPYPGYSAVSGVVPDGGYALSGPRKAAEPELSTSYSIPQVRASAAPPGKLYPAPFPALCRMAATPYPAYERLLNLSYQTLAQHRRPAQAQRRRASCTRLRSRHCAGWRLTPYPAYLHPSSKACASRGIPVASPESPHPHDDTFVYSLIYQAESLKLKTM